MTDSPDPRADLKSRKVTFCIRLFCVVSMLYPIVMLTYRELYELAMVIFTIFTLVGSGLISDWFDLNEGGVH